MQPIIDTPNLPAQFAILEERIGQYGFGLAAPDLILLPDFFCVFDSIQILEFAQLPGLQNYKLIRQMAMQNQAIVSVCLPVIENKKTYRRNVWMPPQASVLHHDLELVVDQTLDQTQNQTFVSTHKPAIFECKGWRFVHTLAQNLSQLTEANIDYDVLICRGNVDTNKQNKAHDLINLADDLADKNIGLAHTFWQNRLYYHQANSILLKQNRLEQQDILVVQLIKK